MYRINRSFPVIALIALFLLSFSACSNTTSSGGTSATGGTTAANASPEVAATVNDKKIMMSEVDRLLNQQAQGQQTQLAPLELAQARLQILQNLIQQEVMFQRAEREKLLPTDEDVTQAIATLKQQGNLTEEEFQKTLQARGQTEQQLREDLRRQLAFEKLQNKTATNIGDIRDKEVEDFYNNNKAQFVNARGVSLAAVVVDPRDNGAQDDAKSEAEAKVKADNIYQQLKNGGDFATVARARSEDQTNARGGDLEFLTEEQLKQSGFPPGLITSFFAMNPGDITPVVPTSDGRFTIFKLQRKQLQNENLNIDSPGVRDEIKKALISQRQSMLNAVFMETAMNEARVVNNLARNILNNPGNLSGPRPAGTPATAAPAAGASPAGNTNANSASTIASPAASPAATASPR